MKGWLIFMINVGKYTSPMDGMGVVLNISIEPMPSLFLYMYYIYTFHQSRAGYGSLVPSKKTGVYTCASIGRVGPVKPPIKNSPAIIQVKDCIARWWFQIFFIFRLFGEDFQFDKFISIGLKPPTRLI